MKKLIRTLGQFGLGLMTFLITSCKVKVVESSTAQTAGNDPTIKKGESFSYSKSTTPKRFDFICFLGELPGLEKKYLQVYRLCGMPGDVVEIKSGDLYVNNRLVDDEFQLKHNYLLQKSAFEQVKNSLAIDANYSSDFHADTVIVPMDDSYVKHNKVNARRLILSPTFKDSAIANRFKHLWNQDNFGPIEVPNESYFVLGDNRHNAWDSRFRGFIDKKDFLGTVVFEQ